MNVAVLCSGSVLQPTLEALYSQGLLAGVAVPGSGAGEDVNLPLEMALRQAGIPFLRVRMDDLTGQLTPWLGEIAADVVCCMGFPGKIPPELLELPPLGFFNLHGGALPRYRGPDPVFWQIKNREPFGAITIHRMTPKIDGGGIAHTERVVLGPEDTYALHMQRLGGTLPRVMIEFIQQLVIQGDSLPLHTQEAATAPYLPRPTETDRTIDWSQPAAETDALVRACNPISGGAMTILKGIPVRLLEVSPAPPCTDTQTAPGTIIAASAADGIRVVCGQGETLALEIIYASDGFFSGRRLAHIFGLGPGDRLG